MITAIVILSRDGLELARKVRAARGESTTIFGPSCVVGACSVSVPASQPSSSSLPARTFATEEPGVCGWLGPLRLVLPEIWERYEAIVAIMALGIVVRLVGPLLRDKRRDPAVVVVDHAGRFAVSMLGGRGPGANELAERVAEILGAQPVVTSSSVAQKLPAVEQIGQHLGGKDPG